MGQGSWIMFMEIFCKEIVKVLVQVGYLIIFSNVDTVLIQVGYGTVLKYMQAATQVLLPDGLLNKLKKIEAVKV